MTLSYWYSHKCVLFFWQPCAVRLSKKLLAESLIEKRDSDISKIIYFLYSKPSSMPHIQKTHFSKYMFGKPTFQYKIIKFPKKSLAKREKYLSDNLKYIENLNGF